MITNKNNSGWILCPSNTFPGKFYYFNVLNGETAWSIGDTEKKVIKKNGGVPKVMEYHHHPEPSSPPTAYNPVKTDTIKLNQPTFTRMQHPTPIFGQSVFPKTLPTKPEAPNVIWTPIQIQVPIVCPETKQNHSVIQNSNQKIYQVTQMPEIAEELFQKRTLEVDKEVLVQSCVKPLCQRFVNYEKPVISFDKDNKIQDKKLFDKFYTSTPIKKSLMSSMPMFQTVSSNISSSFEDLNPKVANQKLIIKKPNFNVEVPSNTPEKVAITSNNTAVQWKIKPSFEDLNPKVANQKLIIKKPTFNVEVPSNTPEKVAITSNNTAVQWKINPSCEDLQPEVANKKQIIKKPTFNVEVLSNTPEKVAITSNNTAVQWKINPSCEDLQTEVANQKQIIKKPTFNVEVLCKALQNVAIASKTKAIQSKINLSFEHLQPTVANQKSIINKPFINIEVPSNTNKKDFKDCKKVEPKNDFKDQCTKDLPVSEKMLNNFDLRMLLVAKRRISQDLVVKRGDIECKVLETTKQESTQQPKKRVTFNLDYESFQNDYEDENAIFKEKHTATMESLKGLSGAGPSDQWCIVVDTQILLEEFSFLDRFVQIDPNCKLLIPSSVYSEVSAVSRGDCRGRSHVTHARTVMRRLTHAHIKVQSADDEGNNSPINDAILKCCVETMDHNMHLILITNNEELLRTAKCYPIPCYNIQDIKNGLAQKPKLLEFKQVKITIPNDADSKFTQNGIAVHSFRRTLLETNDLNEKEKEIIRKFKLFHIVANSENNGNSNTNSKTYENFTITKTIDVNGNPESSKINSIMSKSNSYKVTHDSYESTNTKSILNVNSKISNTKSMIYSESSRTGNAIPITAITNSKNPSDYMKLDTDSMKLNPNSRISNEDSMIPNANSKDSVKDSKIPKTPHPIPVTKVNSSTISNANARILNEKLKISTINPKALTTEWQCANDFTVDVDIENLNWKENQYNEKYKTTLRSEKNNSNEIVSFVSQNPTLKFNIQKIRDKIKNSTVSPYLQNGGPNSPFVFGENTKPVKEINKEKPACRATKPIRTILETNKVKEPPNSVFENKEKSNMAASNIDIDVYKKPQSIQPSDRVKRNNELGMFYVKNKMIENRLLERMDEWLCSFRQVMEEILSGILEKQTSSALKSTPPWSLYEALKCTRTVYKDHTAVTKIVDDLCGFLYDPECRNDKTKNLNPDDLIKCIGCGINLTKYLKNIYSHQHMDEIQETEKCLLDMLNQIEDPARDINEPLVKTPVVGNSNDKIVRQNFIKNRSEIVNYLKKHYTEWKNYDENDDIKTKNVRTVDKDLLKFETKMATVHKNNEIVDQSDKTNKLTVGTATKNVNNATRNVGDPTTNTNVVVRTKIGYTNRNNAMGNVVNSLKSNAEILERTKIVPSMSYNNALKNVSKNPTVKELERTQVIPSESENTKIIHCQKNAPKLTKTINNECVDSKDAERLENSKPIFDYVKPKETIQKYNKEHIGNSSQKGASNKFKIDSQMLEVKITIPNDYKKVLEGARKEDKNVHKTPEKVCIPNEKHRKDTKESNLSANYETKLSSSCTKTTGIKKDLVKLETTRSDIHKTIGTNENAPKIIRNVNLVKEFEERIKNKKSTDLEDLDYSSNTKDSLDYDGDKTHYSNPNEIDSQNSELKDRLENAKNKLNYSETANGFDLNTDSNTSKDNLNDHSVTDNNLNNGNESLNARSKNAAKYNKIKNVSPEIENSDFKNDVTVINDRKSYKDDMTYDSGLGNESPRMHCVVESFSSDLEVSLEFIQKFIDGSMQDFRARKLSEERKKKYQLKAFEAYFLLMKIMRGLHKLSQKELNTTEQTGDDTDVKSTSRNIEAISKCLKHAQTLQGVLNMMLSVTEEDGSALHSSMSLNASS